MKEYKKIYIENKLCEIRNTITESNHMILNDSKKVEQTNEAMRKVLSDLYDSLEAKENVMSIFNLTVQADTNKDVDTTLTLYYFALYNDNVSLLQELLKNDFNFNVSFNSLNLHVLDRRISSKFDMDNYIDLVKRYNLVFKNFYSSIKDLIEKKDDEKLEKYINRFSYIMNTRPSVVRSCGGEEYTYLLTQSTLAWFNQDYLIKAPDNQKRIINSVSRYNGDYMGYASRLICKYPDYDKSFSVSLIERFTVDELYAMSSNDIRLYDEANFRGLLSRMIEIKKIKPDFTCPLSFIDNSLFSLLTNEEIVALSTDKMEDLGEFAFLRKKSTNTDFFKTYVRSFVERDNLKNKVKRLLFNNIIND